MTKKIHSIFDLAAILQDLNDALNAFHCACLKPGAVIQGMTYNPFDGSMIPRNPDELLVDCVTEITFSDDMENGSVRRFPGCFEVSREVLGCAEVLNAAKARLKDAVKDLESSGLKPHNLRSIYNNLGYGRMHPLQAWRQVQILNGPGLESIGFTVAKSIQGIEALTHAQAMERLKASDAQDVIAQVEEYRTKTFHWHTPVSAHVRANCSWINDSVKTSRMLHASLPFLVAEGGWPSKRIRFNVPKAPAKDKRRRTDVKASFLVVDLPFRAGSYIALA